MNYSKPERVSSKDNLDKVRQMRCAVCYRNPPSEPHHFQTKGAGGGDEYENLIPLCHKHHREFHDMGAITWLKKYPNVINQRKLWGLPPLKLSSKQREELYGWNSKRKSES